MAGAKGYDVKDIRTAAAGRRRIEWAKKDKDLTWETTNKVEALLKAI